MGQAAAPQPTSRTETGICWTPILKIQRMIAYYNKRTVFGLLVSGQINGCMGGRSDGGWLDIASRPDGLTDRPTDQLTE